ncbi:MAG: fibronectin type III domain-containing protein [Polyangiaceae bacterium]|nr:fibronectin type III domain-containing protein [Polyangiaceae bacterium]
MATRRSAWLGAVLTAWALLALAGGASAQQAGDLDTSFGTAGFAALPGGGDASYYATAVDSEGRIVAVGTPGGQWAVHRFSASGIADTAFNNAVLGVLPAGSIANDVAVDGDDRIVVVGRCGTLAAGDPMLVTVIRLTPAGALDASFGGGIVRVAIDSKAWAQAVEIQNDGRIVVAGTCRNSRGYTSIFLARFYADGSLDNGSFGSRGYVIDDFNSKKSEGVHQGALVVRADGKIVIGGYDGAATTDFDANGWTLVRYTGSGARDTSFGSQGIVRETSLAGFANLYVSGLAPHIGDTLLVCGRGWSSQGDSLVVRYTDSGTRDTGFGLSGVAMSGLDLNTYFVHTRQQVAVDGNDRILVCGTRVTLPFYPPSADKIVFRFTPNGLHDGTFGQNGGSEPVRYPSADYDGGLCLTLDNSGGILVGGNSSVGESRYLSIARFHGEQPTPAVPPSEPGGLTAVASSSSRIDLGWTDHADNEQGFKIERSPNGETDWVQVATVGVNATGHEDTGLAPNTKYHYRVYAYNAAGDSGYSNVGSDTTLPGAAVEDLAANDIPVAGTVTGNYVNTQSNDSVNQSIEEMESAGNPAKNRYSYLEHKWTFNVTGGNTISFHLKAYRTNSTDGDSFAFAYSTNGTTFTDLVTVVKTSDDGQYQTCMLPSSLSGTVYIRVRDTDRTKGHRSFDTIFIDHMFIRSE